MITELEQIIHERIEQASDKFYDKRGYEPDVVYINKSQYLNLLREKEDLRSLMGKSGRTLKNRIAIGLVVRIHWRKTIVVKSFKK